MGDSFGESDQDLRSKARQRIAAGRLPRAKAARTWGGLGSGLLCTLCDEPILNTEPEFELQFDTSSSSPPIRFHRRCHSIWEAVRHEPMMADEHWTPVSQALPSIGAPVEVRWEMGDARTIILGSMAARDPGTGELIWINLTTKAPLPHGWRAIEWRPSPGTSTGALGAPEPVTTSFPKRA